MPTLRNGWRQGLAAILVASAIAAIVITASWGQSQTPGRLAIAGVVLFMVTLGLGSSRLVMVTSVPILGSAIATVVGDPDPAWVRGLVIGVLWYVAAELAWDSIERRDAVRRTGAVNDRRINEISTVVGLTLLLTVAAIVLSGRAPLRTIFVLGLAIVAVAMALTLAASRLFGANKSLSGKSDRTNEIVGS